VDDPGTDEPAATESDDAVPATGAPPAPRASAGSRWPIVAAVAMVLAVGLGAVALAKNGDANDLADERDARREVARVSAEFGEAYLSYDFDDVDGASDAVVALASEAFAKDFADTRAPGIEELFANLKTSTKATTTEVFVSDVGDRQARSLVVVDVAATSTSSGNQSLKDLSFVLDLVHEDGEWRVDAVAPAPQPDIADDGTEGGTDAGATSTTLPAASTSSTVAPG
jgi:hypothetical protein